MGPVTKEGIDAAAALGGFWDVCDEFDDGSDGMFVGRLAVLALPSDGFGFALLREREPTMSKRIERRNYVIKISALPLSAMENHLVQCKDRRRVYWSLKSRLCSAVMRRGLAACLGTPRGQMAHACWPVRHPPELKGTQ